MPATDDALELLTRLGTIAACSVTLMDELGWSGTRFAEAVHGIRERHNVRVRTTGRETIRIRREDFTRATRIATAYANRHLLN